MKKKDVLWKFSYQTQKIVVSSNESRYEPDSSQNWANCFVQCVCKTKKINYLVQALMMA